LEVRDEADRLHRDVDAVLSAGRQGPDVESAAVARRRGALGERSVRRASLLRPIEPVPDDARRSLRRVARRFGSRRSLDRVSEVVAVELSWQGDGEFDLATSTDELPQACPAGYRYFVARWKKSPATGAAGH
jgi:hypothetical protein